MNLVIEKKEYTLKWGRGHKDYTSLGNKIPPAQNIMEGVIICLLHDYLSTIIFFTF
jgi:hypothetical protein